MNDFPYTIRPIDDTHSKSVMTILNHYIENSFAAYFDHPLPDFFFDKIREMIKGYPAFVACESKEGVVGFAFLHAYHPAPTFRRTAEITYFIHPDHTRKGLGKFMLDELITQALKQNIDNIVASISSLNSASLTFHVKNGFHECGRLEGIGRKCERDFDVVYMQRHIG